MRLVVNTNPFERTKQQQQVGSCFHIVSLNAAVFSAWSFYYSRNRKQIACSECMQVCICVKFFFHSMSPEPARSWSNIYRCVTRTLQCTFVPVHFSNSHGSEQNINSDRSTEDSWWNDRIKTVLVCLEDHRFDHEISTLLIRDPLIMSWVTFTS